MKKSTLAVAALATAFSLAAAPAQASYQIADNLTLSAKFYSDLSFSDNDSDTGFHLKRSYLTLKTKVDERMKLRLTLDQKSENVAGNGGVFVKYAYVDYMLDGNTTARAGLVNTPFVGFDEDRMWGHRYIASSFTDFWKAQTSADLGASVMGAAREGQVEYQVSVLNGEGYGNSTNGDGFALAGRLNVDLGKAVVGGWFHEEKGRNGVADYDPSRMGVFALFEQGRYRVSGQYMIADDNVNNQTFDSGRGFNVQGQVELPKVADHAFARYDRIDRMDNGNDASLLIVGVEKKVGDKLTISPNIRRHDTGGSTGSADTIGLYAQLKL